VCVCVCARARACVCVNKRFGSHISQNTVFNHFETKAVSGEHGNMAVYCEDHTKHINKRCEQKMWSFCVNLHSIQ